MRVFNGYKNIDAAAQGTVLVIGNFDGVHKGHQALLETARAVGQKQDTKTGVLTFEPHPRKLFRPDDPPFRLTPAPLKRERLGHAGVDYLFEIPFDWDFASQSAEDFVRNILIDGLGAAHIVVGYDFRFGQLRKGSAETIRAAGLPVSVVEEVPDVSSTNIRQALRHGDLDRASALLGWDWEIWGEVVKGDRRGHALGYPTANVPLGATVHPAYGVYAAHVQVEGEEQWHGAAVNIGIRPMFEIPEAQVEAHIFDFDREIYGQTLKIRPVKFLRGEAKFSNVEDLVKQMEQDCIKARAVLKG